MMIEFKDKYGPSINGIEFQVEILTSGHWPYQDAPECAIPKQLQAVQTKFQHFYKQKF